MNRWKGKSCNYKKKVYHKPKLLVRLKEKTNDMENLQRIIKKLSNKISDLLENTGERTFCTKTFHSFHWKGIKYAW